MKKEKLIPIVLVSLSCVLFVVAIILILNTNYFKFNNNQSGQENNSGLKEDKPNTDNSSNVGNSNDNNNVNNDESTNMENNTEDEKTETNKQDSIINNETYNENSVISYFNLSKDSIGTNQEDKTLREKAKSAFTTIVDFIFYDKEIKGYTFSKLTTKAKLEIIEIALTIDNKIDKHFPDYKETIKDKYTNIKGKLAIKYLEFTSKLCDNVGSDTCNQAKEDFNTMKESFGFTWQLIKELASSGSSKLKEFYESWRDSE